MATREQSGADSERALRLPERYRVRRHLANGGMAGVWCAEDQVLGRTVAIKVLAERFASDEMAMRRFKREARAAARVSNHAHVVTIFDVGDLEPEPGAEQAPSPFIVMEYLAGGTVADAIRVGSVRRQEAVRWIREAASALDHAHARGIVHRDIKPANFLLNRSRVLHVADFGIARLVSEDTISSAGELFGTAAYLSPEQALGREATGASDRYALAVAAFELLAGERPFLAQHFAAQARQHIEEDPPYPSTVDRSLPPCVDPVLMRGMAKEPEERFESAGAFVDALETALSGGVPITTRMVTPARRRPAPRSIPAAAGRAAGLMAGAADLHRRRDDTSVTKPQSFSDAWTPANSLQRGSFGRRRAGRIAALAALLVAIAVVGALAVTGLGGSRRSANTTALHTHSSVVHHHAAPQRVAKAPAAKRTSTSSTTSTPAPAAPPTAEELQMTGHQEMEAGNYRTAIVTLRRAVSAADPASLTYAYGLYDLGRALVLAGDPGGAVPILEQRLKIPNQTPVVRQELDQALIASGQKPPSPPAPPSKGKPAKGGPGSGGAGIGAPSAHGASVTVHPSFVE